MARGTRATIVLVAATLLALGALATGSTEASTATGPTSAHPTGKATIVDNVAATANKASAPLSELGTHTAPATGELPALDALRVEGNPTPSHAARPSVGSRAPPLALRFA
jgi:hypothetical protein